MNCHIIIHQKNSHISIRGKFEALKPFLPNVNLQKTPGKIIFRDNASRNIEIVITPETPTDARIEVDLAARYLSDLSDSKSGRTIPIARNELTQIIRDLQKAGKSI